MRKNSTNISDLKDAYVKVYMKDNYGKFENFEEFIFELIKLTKFIIFMLYFR